MDGQQLLPMHLYIDLALALLHTLSHLVNCAPACYASTILAHPYVFLKRSNLV